MYSKQESELDRLRKIAENHTAVEEKLSSQIEENEGKSYLPTDTLVQQMMFDKLKENWDMLNLSDIEAICRT